MEERLPLEEKTVLITGAYSGLGRAIAREAAGAGARLGLLGRDRERLEGLASDLEDPAPLLLHTDLTDPDGVTDAVDRMFDRFGALDVLVNNAGVFRMAPVDEMSMEDWEASIGANMTGPWLLARAAVAHWREAHGRGHIINIASLGGVQGFGDLSAYCASKHGMVGLGRALAEELRPLGVRVTNLLPHSMDTADGPEPEGADRWKMLGPETVARLVVQAAAAPPWAAVEEIRVVPQATSSSPHMIEPRDPSPEGS